jgi:hypothetical protein
MLIVARSSARLARMDVCVQTPPPPKVLVVVGSVIAVRKQGARRMANRGMS